MTAVAAEASKDEWQDGDECQSCNKKFTFSRRKHHCRFCGHVFCNKCSSGREDGKRACWECCASKRTASPDGGRTSPVLEAGTSPVLSPAVFPSSMPGGLHLPPVIMDPPQLPSQTEPSVPATPSSPTTLGKKITGKINPGESRREAERLTAQVAELDNQVAVLNQELIQYKGFFANACANLCRFEEARKKEDAAQEEKSALLSMAKGEYSKQISERKAEFAKGVHHRKSCVICDGAYSVTKREHHCRICYESVCHKCSPQDPKGARACMWCTSRGQLTSSHFAGYTKANPACALAWVALLEAASEKVWRRTPQGAKQQAEQQQQQLSPQQHHAQHPGGAGSPPA